MPKITKIVEVANDDDDDAEAGFFGAGSHDDDGGDEDGGGFAGGDQDSLRAVARLARLAGSLPWFAAVGRRLTPAEIDAAEAYVGGLGFPGMHVAGVEDWLAASGLAQAPDFGDEFWQAEEQMRRALTDEALQFCDAHDLEVALAHVATRTGEVAHERAVRAAARQGVSDPDLIKVAAGAAAQATHQAALVLAAGGGAEHPFALKFRLFEFGRLPLGNTGGTFNLF